ncbi:MAG: DegQ family serine endoprotease [Burkholderiales bacterium]|nr:DegQ family serine endoprotease [Burkholderiales bacterium]
MFRSTKLAAAIAALSVGLAACSPNESPISQALALGPAQQTGENVVPPERLPNFASLVEQEGDSVVNISTTRSAKAGMPQFPGMSEDDPFFEFFKRFAPPGARPGPGGPGVPGGPEAPGSDPREFQAQGLGSGFIISEDGYILTNAHVVADADEVTVKMADGKAEYKAKVIGFDKRTDVALLKVDATNLPKVTIGNSSGVKVGEWVAAIGSPFGFANSVTAGIVSAKGRSLPDDSYVPFIQTDVAVNPGNSGGPLLNLKGEVIGINSQIYSRTGGYQGVSFAIPIEVAMDIGKQLQATGKVTRGRLGVVIQQVTPELAKSFGLKDSSGALVASVEPGSPAEKAGLKRGDVILKYEGKPVESSIELPRVVGTTKPGTTTIVQVWRDGGAQDIKVVVGEIPSEKVAARAEQAPARTANRLGLVLNEMSPEQRSQTKSTGLIVQSVQGSSAKAGIREGDVILAVNDKEVSSTEQFDKLVVQSSAEQPVALLVRRGENTLYIAVKPNASERVG